MGANHEIPSKEFSKHCKLHRCTRSLLYKVQTQKTHSAEKNKQRNKEFSKHCHQTTSISAQKKDYLRNHWKRQLQCNITTSSTVTKLLHWRVHFFIALESSYFLLHWKVRISNGAVLRLTPPTLNFPELKSGDKLYFGRGPDAEN